MTDRRTEIVAVALVLLAAVVLAVAVPAESRVAARPGATVDVIVRFSPETTAAERRAAVRAAGGTVTHDLHLIGGLGARMPRAAAERLRTGLGVRSVAFAVPVASRSAPPATAYNAAIGIDRRADRGLPTGRGVGVAVVDTGIDGTLPDFAASRHSRRSRVRATAVVNPRATSAADQHGHGTHVAGIIAGRRGRYSGVAPAARLVSIKIADDEGRASTLDAIYGIQFAVDHADRLGIDVLNLSLASAVAESAATDPLAAAAEAAWLEGLVVVAAAGNAGADADAVSYAPGNDPYVITVGAFDDRGTADGADDADTPWSSHGVTQAGLAKPDVLAPGAGIVSTLARGSRFAQWCPACVVDGAYFRASGTSMSTAVASGAAALILEEHPDWTPDQVKAALGATASDAGFLDVPGALAAEPEAEAVAQHHPTNVLVDPDTGAIDYAAASWRAASWRYVRGAAASWRCDCGLTAEGQLDPQAASWRAASWRVLPVSGP